MDSPPPKGLPGSFVLMTHNNSVDLGDVLALTGTDSELSIQHAIFVAKDDIAGYLDEHSLLMSGHFNQTRIYKSAIEGGARRIVYRGLSVLVIEPFARERGEMDDVRWLVVLGTDLLLFGSIPSVAEELDRYLAHDTADPVLAGKLAHLRRDDETWTIVWRPVRNSEIRRVLAALDSRLGELSESADSLLFGIRYRRQVEIEYEATTGPHAPASSVSIPVQSFDGPGRGIMLLPSLEVTDADKSVRGVMKLPTPQFSKWLEKVPSN